MLNSFMVLISNVKQYIKIIFSASGLLHTVFTFRSLVLLQNLHHFAWLSNNCEFVMIVETAALGNSLAMPALRLFPRW